MKHESRNKGHVRFKEYSIPRLTKLRGQHLLTDVRVLDDIVRSAELTSTDVVLEVGPGLGVLTKELATRAGRVVAVEIDRRFEPKLIDVLHAASNVELVWGDILRLPPPVILFYDRKIRQSYKIVSNLPYQITTPFLWKFLELTPLHPPYTKGEIVGYPDLLVLLVQREVAERIVARPPHMNLLALLVQTFGTAEIIRRVPPGAFRPPPRVESAVIRIRRGDVSRPCLPAGRSDHVSRSGHVRQVILSLAKKAFAAPRKKIGTTLKNYAELSQCGIEPDFRPERISVEDWLCIARAVQKRI